MVYEVKCSNCGDILDFGGEDPSEKFEDGDKIPEDAIEFNDEVYCRSCVEEFIKFGSDDIEDRLQRLETKVNKEL